MTEHLLPYQIEGLSTSRQISTPRLRGKELLAALNHIQVCEDCRLKIKPPTREEILERIFGDD